MKSFNLPSTLVHGRRKKRAMKLSRETRHTTVEYIVLEILSLVLITWLDISTLTWSRATFVDNRHYIPSTIYILTIILYLNDAVHLIH